jgi:hypothetical protein
MGIKMKSLLLVATISFGALAAPVSPMDGFTTTEHSKSDLNRFWRKIQNVNKDMKGKDCFKRANIWSYKLNREDGVKSKKVFMHYTDKFNLELDNMGRSGLSSMIGGMLSSNTAWDFHVAPAVNIEGVDYIIDPKLRDKPETIENWVEFLTERGEGKLRARKFDLIKDLNKYSKRLRRALSEKDEDSSREDRLREKIKEIKDKMSYLGVNSDPNQKIDIKCKKINHIMEFDTNQTGEWCFYQESSMYYYATLELRYLNYGDLDTDMRHPLTNPVWQDERNYQNGRSYIVRDWNRELLEESLEEYKPADRPDSIWGI